MQRAVSKTLACALGIMVIVLIWAGYALVKAEHQAVLAMEQAELANQRIDHLVEKIYNANIDTQAS